MPSFLHNFFILFFIGIYTSYVCVSQTKYPTDTTYLNTLSNSDKNQFSNFSQQAIDTIIDNYHNYYPRNTSGNIGLPSSPLFLSYQASELGLVIYQAPYINDMMHERNVNYYQTKGAYADLTGIAGSKQEQMFKMLFSNTFKNKLNLSLGFNRYGALGFYLKQQSFINNFFTSSNYKSKNERFGYYSYFVFNKIKHQENGGILNDTFFIQNVMINKQLLPVNLNSARTENRTSNLDFNPWFRLNKNSDSTKKINHFIDYKINYSGNYLKYFDEGIASDNFYTLYYLDTLTTRDSVHWRKLTNQLNYVAQLKQKGFKFKIGAKHEYNQIYQKSDSLMSNIIGQTGLYYNRNLLTMNITYSQIFSGVNNGDYLVDFNSTYKTPKKISILHSPLIFSFRFNSEKRQPNLFYNNWFSNHFIWTNKFKQTEKTEALLSLKSLNNRFEAGALIQQHVNFIYLNETANPVQTPIPIENVVLFVKKNTLLFNHLGINAEYHFQNSSYSAIVPVPKHVISGALFFQKNIKKSMLLQIGFSAQYFSEFYGYAYMPALNSFYVQSQNTVGNYPFVDFFINARIKPVRFFVKIDHLNQGLMGTGYKIAPGYIQNDRAFKFGINWLFFD
jgi:hypothetical protein